MDNNRSYTLTVLRQLLKYLEISPRYTQVKKAIECLINKLLDRCQPISYNIRMALSFATTPCEVLLQFDNREEDNELQRIALTALDTVDLCLKL
jgi:hypothetical protein